MRKRRWSVPWLVLAALAAGLVEAEGQPASSKKEKKPSRQARALAAWQQELREIHTLLRADEAPDRAYERSSRLLQEMTDRIGSGPGVGRVLGSATTLRAIAAVRLGRPDEGIWHWQVAQQLFPDLAADPLTPYGEAGAFLRQHPVRPPKGDQAFPQDEGLVPDEGQLEPPQKKRALAPRFPRAKKRGGLSVAVVVETIIGEDGRVREPRIVESQGELTLVCATLDALRAWEFEPARREGRPVAVYYQLTINFRTQLGQ